MPYEVETFLNDKLRAGKINGSVYQGECCCLIGSFANIKDCNYETLPVKPNARRPAERWFLSIRPGRTPENSFKVKEIEGWVLEWMEKNKQLLTAK